LTKKKKKGTGEEEDDGEVKPDDRGPGIKTDNY
jgi:hypothetical protein